MRPDRELIARNDEGLVVMRDVLRRANNDAELREPGGNT
jgi:hypothetical protein